MGANARLYGGAVMSSVTLDVADWAEQQFGTCEFGDKRRTKRMVKLATQVAMKPDAATPEQTENWGDCKATYRLAQQKKVTFDAVTAPHYALTRAVESGTWLVINDTTEINFGCDRELFGVGRVGSNEGRGFFLHTAMIVGAASDEIVGLAAQELYLRPLKKVKRVTSAQRKTKRQRETDVWGRVIDRVGSAPQEARFIHVCDRGADNFDVFCHLVEQKDGWVIRAAQLKRRVRDDVNRECSLEDALRGQPVLGSYELKVSANHNQPARTAHMEVRYARIVMPRPKTGISPYVRNCGVEEIPMGVVETLEVNPPRGVQPLRWILLTSEPVYEFGDAWQIIEWYEKRPLIEEYHKCLKTGCSVEARQYRSGDRLAPIIGLLSVVAVRLLQLKMVARTDPERGAARVVPTNWLFALPRLMTRPKPIVTVRDFFRSLASLGGFLGRKSDGEPGWQTVWRGLETLLQCLRGAEALGKKSG
jgi:Transposase DNA-binding/Transposase Tn5 dimerisation domain